MSILIKFCGMTRQEDILQAAKLGVNYLGFVLVPASRRCLTRDQLPHLLQAVPKTVKTVFVVADLEFAEIQSLVADFHPDVIQLHGRESPEFAQKIRDVEVWKAIHIQNELDLANAVDFPADCLVADAGQGGSGQICNWPLAAKLATARKIFLAGGITPENVAEALRQTHPAGIDAASGIEKNPGRKDPARMRKFLQNLHTSEKHFLS